MLILGARGMAIEVFEVLKQTGYNEEIFFFDDVTPNAPETIYGARVLHNITEAIEVFIGNNNYVLGLGNPDLRRKINEKFVAINGQLNSVVSPFANVGKFGNSIGVGSTIMTGVVITNGVTVGRGALVNVNVSISHDSSVGEFAEISPGAVITGRCTIGDYAIVGSNATILPGVRIGNFATVGAGAVVTKDVADNIIVTGIPARPVKDMK